jgi:hypothetical protein
MGYREPTPEQEEGSEFAGTVLQNTLPPKPSVKDLSPAEQRRLIVTTGQDTDPAATARQTGPDPEAPPPPRYMR